MSISQRKLVNRHELRRRGRNKIFEEQLRRARPCITPLGENVVIRVVLVATCVFMMNALMVMLIVEMVILVNAVILMVMMRDVDQAGRLEQRMRGHRWPQHYQPNRNNLSHQPHRSPYNPISRAAQSFSF